ncbi:MAG: type II toxin-antitoxin system VapC family toxin [Ectothiorhodospiraceae bacterium]|nr:type II toxin-antitoxin system VapC family toxin [Ectothiorhodospiraceae bacterium]
MYLIDTNVLSEIRKNQKANKGVRDFFESIANETSDEQRLFISVVTIGELRRGIELIKHRGDTPQADRLEKWLRVILDEYRDNILEIDDDTAQLWGKLRVPHPGNAIDKFIAATALIHGLTVVTRNNKDFIKTGVPVLNPFV